VGRAATVFGETLAGIICPPLLLSGERTPPADQPEQLPHSTQALRATVRLDPRPTS